MAEAIGGPDAAGSVVAFEGHPETVSTQLRLLPTSPHILILPSVQCYLPKDDTADKFEAHDFIRKAHEAVLARHEAARSFIEGPAHLGKRLVFMNGGTPSAQAMCIRQIMRHETDGDDAEAEAMFNYLVQEGLAGLESQSKKWSEQHTRPVLSKAPTGLASAVERSPSQSSPKSKRQKKPEPLQLQDSKGSSELDEDPITRAMRAAEALDRETANLQPSNELDLTLAPRPRSLSLPMYSYSDTFGDAAPFVVFGARRRANSDVSVGDEAAAEEAPVIPTAPRFSVIHYEKQTLTEPIDTTFVNPENSPSCAGETYGPTFLHSPLIDALPTSRTDIFDPRSPGEVEFGEASLVDMRMQPTRDPVTRVRSLDRFYPTQSTSRNLNKILNNGSTNEAEAQVIRRPHSCMVVPSGQRLTSNQVNVIDGPRTIHVRPKQRSVVSLTSVPLDRKRKAFRSSYVDRGTDAEVIEKEPQPFVPVLTLVEDLVVTFKDDVPDALLENAVKNYRNGDYPVLLNPLDSSESATVSDELPSTPTSQSIQSSDVTPKASPRQETMLASPSVDTDEYDPFAYVQSWPPPKPAKKQPVAPVERPPTPEQTPVPSVREGLSGKFHDFKVVYNQPPVGVQNSLRSILGVYFPPETQAYRQFSFALLPELEGLWSPVFREAEPGSPRGNSRRMDQILAIGSQKGVVKEYSSAIMGLLDKVGSKRSGVSRSGRLDFRYLLANAMQAFTAQPLANQTSDNPFTNPYLLATLIVPHLETYLALHSEVRYLLLEYPPEHLPTILSLQRLVGVDLMKVAQIVDAENTSLGPFTHLQGASVGSEDLTQGGFGKPGGLSSASAADYSVSKANFLLTSSASDTEIATFIATVRKILMGVSQFYVPEEPIQPPRPPKKQPTRKSKPAALSGTFTPFPKSTGLSSPTVSPTATSPTTTAAPKTVASPPPSTRAASIAETVRTFRTTRTGRSARNPKSKRLAPPTDDGSESIMTYDPAEDSDYDQEERRLMPIYLQKSSSRPKPSSRKALKFLGLA